MTDIIQEPELSLPIEALGPPAPKRRWFASAAMVTALVVIAALVGAGAAAVVARATGWGKQTTVQRYVTNTSTITGKPTDIQNLLVKILPDVVLITATVPQTSNNPFFGRSGTVTDEGTGIIISADGQILTNDHVVDGATSITVTRSGSTTALTATVIGSDSTHDLALLKIDATGLPVPTLGDSTKTVVGDGVVAVGYALALKGSPSVTAGIVSATGREVSTQSSTGATETLTDMIQTDAAISSGNSGGPLVDASGQVIGITTMIATSTATNSASNVGFAIPTQTINSLLPSLRAGH